MEEFLTTYGLWILLGVIFVAMHRFGMGCGGGHRHGSGSPDEQEPRSNEEGREKKSTEPAGRRGGCH